MENSKEKNRAIALERAFVISRLLDSRYYSKVSDALKEKGEKGRKDFEAVCKEAGIPTEMIEPLHKALSSEAVTAKLAWST